MLEAIANGWDWVRGVPHLGWWLSLAWGLYLVVLAGWIVLQKREPVATLSWLLSLAALPLIGYVIYYFLGPLRIRRQRLHRARARAALDGCVPPAGDHADSADLARLAQATTGFAPTRTHAVSLLIGGAPTFDALLIEIERAAHHVHLEYYIFEPDRTGTRVRDALVARAAAGVRVRLLLDAVGSSRLKKALLARSSAKLCRPIRQDSHKAVHSA